MHSQLLSDSRAHAPLLLLSLQGWWQLGPSHQHVTLALLRIQTEASPRAPHHALRPCVPGCLGCPWLFGDVTTTIQILPTVSNNMLAKGLVRC